MTKEEAFIKAYKRCVACAPEADLYYFLENKDEAQNADYHEEKRIAGETEYWSHIEDAWLMWLEAIDFAKETT